jgi:alpha-galactosidase
MKVHALIVVLAVFVTLVLSLNNGAAKTPPRGWSSWMAFSFNVSTSGLMKMADLMVQTGLKDSGYVYLLLDDGWPACDKFNTNGGCSIPAPRDAQGRIVIDKQKFPNGLIEVTNYVHTKGLKFGIYTAPHARTCGGYTGSLQHEAIDAQAFADWGIDFVKLDAGCQDDCSIHYGCLKSSLTRMRDGLNATGRTIVYYIDEGNHTSGPKVYNPFKRAWPDDTFTRTHIATSWAEFVDSWGPDMANMWKLWLDREDNWNSLLDNVHQQVGMQWFQSSGAYNNPDFMTVGQGHMTQGQYRAEMFLYAILGAPLILSFDLTKADKFTMDLVTNPEILAVNQDPDCVQGTNVKAYTSVDVWIKPLSDNTFAVTLLNKDPNNSQRVQIELGNSGSDSEDEDFFSAGPWKQVHIRNLYTRTDLGLFSGSFQIQVPSLDAVILKISPN